MPLPQEFASMEDALGTAAVAGAVVIVVPNLSYASHRLAVQVSCWIHWNRAFVPNSSLPCVLAVLPAVVASTEEEAKY